MAFVRAKKKGNKLYYYLVENKREGKKVRQKILRCLGAQRPTEEEIEAMGRKE